MLQSLDFRRKYEFLVLVNKARRKLFGSERERKRERERERKRQRGSNIRLEETE